MPKNIYNNVEGHRLLDNGRVVEDITSITLPTVEHPTTTLSVNGMAGDLDMPNAVHVNAMDFEVSHNNGTNCKYLNDPGKHTIEVRVVRQRFDTVQADMQHESVKFRIVGFSRAPAKARLKMATLTAAPTLSPCCISRRKSTAKSLR